MLSGPCPTYLNSFLQVLPGGCWLPQDVVQLCLQVNSQLFVGSEHAEVFAQVVPAQPSSGADALLGHVGLSLVMSVPLGHQVLSLGT